MKNKFWISFDCWETILKANPNYKPQRNKLLREIIFPELEVEEDVFNKMVKQAKDFADYSNESLGAQMSDRQSMMLIAFNTNPRIDKTKILQRFEKYDLKHLELFKATLPMLYSDETLDVLKELKSAGIGTNISCNTSFINGELLDIAFKGLGISELFNFNLYSDKIGYSKPSPNFFNYLRQQLFFPKEHILHVGDNKFSDGGSVNVGIDFLHINGDSNKTISETLNYIN